MLSVPAFRFSLPVLPSSMPRPPRLIFGVPRGFEDVAAGDVLRFLPLQRKAYSIEARHDTGSVVIAVQQPEDLQACLNVYDAGHLWSVQRCMLEVGLPLELSKQIVDQLQNERKELPSKRSRTIKEEHASKKRLRARIAPLVDKQATPGEEAVLRLLQGIVADRLAELQQCLAVWSQLKGTQFECPESFALRFDRRETLFPTLNSKDLAREAGGALYDALCRLSGQEKQKVDLTDPDIEVSEADSDFDPADLILYQILMELLPGFSEDSPITLIYSVALPPPNRLSAHRSFNRVHGRTSLVPSRAYCLCLLHPELSRKAADQSKEVVSKILFDPCGGLGSIPLEIAAIARREDLRVSCLSGDIELPSLNAALENSQRATFGLSSGLGGVDAGLLIDGRGQGRTGGFRADVLDGIGEYHPSSLEL